MMNQLDQARLAINKIDKELALLFVKRMLMVRKIIQYKKEHNIPIYDSSREEYLINQNSTYLPDTSLLPYYQQWLKETLAVSKLYQSHLIKKDI